MIYAGHMLSLYWLCYRHNDQISVVIDQHRPSFMSGCVLRLRRSEANEKLRGLAYPRNFNRHEDNSNGHNKRQRGGHCAD